MNEGRIYATRDEVLAVHERMERENGVFGYIPRSVDLTQEDIGGVRLRVGDYDMDSYHIVSILDGSDDDWHDHEFIATINHRPNGTEVSEWVPIELIDEEVSEEAMKELDDTVEALRELGLGDAEVAAVLEHRAAEVAPNEGVPFWKDSE